MAVEVESQIAAAPIVHSQLIPSWRGILVRVLLEDCEALWVRVNRICDRYMPEPFDPWHYPS
jgi:hypothetical protein